jgi:hypothetical protein
MIRCTESAQSPAQPLPVRLRRRRSSIIFPTGQIAAAAAFVLIVAGVLWWKPWQQRAASSERRAPRTQVRSAGAQSAQHQAATTRKMRAADARRGSRRAGDPAGPEGGCRR